MKDKIPTPPAELTRPVKQMVYEAEPVESPTQIRAFRAPLSSEIISNIVQNGDLSKLSSEDLTAFYIYRCQMLGLDPASKPFDILTLQGKKVLYANKGAAQQLRALHKISTGVIEEREWNGLLVVKVRAWLPDGRQSEDEGFATIANLSGDALGNARLKAMTKASRRAILGLCGLGELDETEVESIPNAKTSAFTEARQLLSQQPKTQSGVIQIVDIREANDVTKTLEVADTDGVLWTFQGDAVLVALNGVGKPVMIDYLPGNVVVKASL